MRLPVCIPKVRHSHLPVQVTKQDDGWYCDYDSKVYPTMVRRYVMLTKCMDGTGELSISIFNEQARSISSASSAFELQGAPTSLI